MYYSVHLLHDNKCIINIISSNNVINFIVTNKYYRKRLADTFILYGQINII